MAQYQKSQPPLPPPHASRLLALQYATFLADTGAYTEADVTLDVLDTMLQGSGLLAVDLRYGSFALRKVRVDDDDGEIQ